MSIEDQLKRDIQQTFKEAMERERNLCRDSCPANKGLIMGSPFVDDCSGGCQLKKGHSEDHHCSKYSPPGAWMYGHSSWSNPFSDMIGFGLGF